MSTAQVRLTTPLSAPGPEELSRADLYALIGRLFYAAPDPALLESIASTALLGEGDDTGLRDAWGSLQAVCRGADPAAVEEEFGSLFVSVGQSAVNPFASYYITGFLNERTLAELRHELAGLGFGRLRASGETEDHVSALAEVMRLMIMGSAESMPLPIETQRAFFERFIKPWYGRLAADLELASAANFYRSVGRFSKAFLDVESASFDIG